MVEKADYGGKTTSIIISSNKIQNQDILVLAGLARKMAIK